ncbi:MAG TPA: FkbM family methyltransferase, partial [Aquella sp.]|nr:FkbM family methyltransferase [Aquella sp.]
SALELHRPEDININVGIGDIESEMDFYVMEDNTLSTFSKQECEKMVMSENRLLKTERIQIRTLDFILEKYNKGTFPDFLSLDAEGMDYLILKTLDYGKYYPKVICVESAEYSPNGTGSRRNELVNFLLEKGYYEYANTNLNSILVKKEFWFV